MRPSVSIRLAVCCFVASLLPAALAAQPASIVESGFGQTLSPAVVASGLSRTTIAEAALDHLSLETAIQTAVANNRSLAAGRLQVEKANEEMLADKTRRLPVFKTTMTAAQLLTPVDFSFPAGSFGTFPGIGPIPSTSTSVSTPRQPNLFVNAEVSQPLTQLIRINLGIDNAVALRDIEREHLREQELSLVNSVKRVYFAILQSDSAVRAADETIALYRELNRTLGVRVAQKVALRSDALDVEVRLAQEEVKRLTAADTLASQKEQLNQLLGRDVRAGFVAEEASQFAANDIDLTAAQGRALDARPDIREARLKVKQAELDRRAKHAENIPDVGVFVSYLSNFNMDVVPQNMASAGVQVSWEPFDWGRKGRELAAKRHVEEAAKLAVREAEDRAVLDVNNRFRKLEENRALLKVARLAQDAARETLRVRTNQFQVQSALLSDVLHEQADVAGANDQFQQALAAFLTAQADFERAVGEDVIR
jgi:outer membrane protein TolC